MVYFKLLLNDKRLKSDNIYPIVVRTTYNRNNTTFNTGIRIEKSHWDETISFRHVAYYFLIDHSYIALKNGDTNCPAVPISKIFIASYLTMRAVINESIPVNRGFLI